ncbi:MAG TPA: LamG domain-containing protein, partial [Sedimentisphaerales bacterium]|nr:LamG domain-containing protein [Sedimentisphaerales bacterium]
ALDGEVTWSLWLKTAPGTVGRSVMVQGPAGAAHVQGNRSIAVEPSGAIMLRAHSVAALANFNSNMRVDDNEWHHVAVAIAFETNGANDTLKVCIDGDLGLGFETDSADINQYGGAAGDFIVTLGARGTFYNGLLDDVAVFNRALSQEEMAGLAGRTDSFYRPF